MDSCSSSASSDNTKGNQGYGQMNVGMPQTSSASSCGFGEKRQEPVERKTGMKNFWLQQREEKANKYYEGLTVSADNGSGVDGSYITFTTKSGHKFTLNDMVCSGTIIDDPIIIPVKDDLFVKTENIVIKGNGKNWLTESPEVAFIFDPQFAGFAPSADICLSGKDVFYSKLKNGNFVI